MPKGPWDKFYIDFFGPLPSGEHLLVVVYRYSQFPEVEVEVVKAEVAIPKLKTDNGPWSSVPNSQDILKF